MERLMLYHKETGKQTKVFRKQGDNTRDGRCAHRDLGISASSKDPTPPAVVTGRGCLFSTVHTLPCRAPRSGAGQAKSGSEPATPYTLRPDY